MIFSNTSHIKKASGVQTMLNRKFLSAMIVAIALGATQAMAALAQPWPNNPVQGGPMPGGPAGTLRDPLIGGAPTSAPFIPPMDGQPPPIGSGPIPWAVTPGMGGPATLLPWVPAIPANSVDQSFSGIPLPVNPAVVSPPGILGPALTGIVPGPESTLGTDPGSLTAPRGYINDAQQMNIIPTGGVPGTGGFNTTIPTIRRGGQETHQWELRGRNSMIGGLGGDGSQDDITRLGPWAGWGTVTGVPTGDGLRNSSIDLGGGQRFKVGGVVIPTGSTIQDFGLSSTRNNPIPALDAQQSYEFGQGFRREPTYSSKTTDFGFPFRQFSAANEDAQKRAQLLLPTVIETNF
jgi:hypothetical protein